MLEVISVSLSALAIWRSSTGLLLKTALLVSILTRAGLISDAV